MSIRMSVIIPVYNAEKYIAACLDSLMGQTLKACEFIFVNDGSQDKSREIIEGCQQRDDRIILINQENNGVSAARNAGLLAARGEYVGFVDADDYVEKDMYERLYEAAKDGDCDIILSNLVCEDNGSHVITRYPYPTDVVLSKDFIKNELQPAFLSTDQLNTACNKIYRNELVKKHSVHFPNKVALGEDGLFNMHFMSVANRMRYIDYAGYYYREVMGSATRNIKGKDYFKRAIEVYQTEFPPSFTGFMNKAQIETLKSIKLIKNVISYIHVYYTPTKEMSFLERYRYVKKMVEDPSVKSALPIYISHVSNTLGRYERLLINLIQSRSIFGLYCAAAYSRFRNK